MSPKHSRIKSLSGKIFSTVLIFTLCIIVAVSAVLTTIYYLSYENDGEKKLLAEACDAAVVLNPLPTDGRIHLLDEQFSGLIRFTLIEADGMVLYDSAAEDTPLGNHADRPEVIAALSEGGSTISRYSETLRTDTVYAAVRLDGGAVIRLSESRESLLFFVGNLVGPVIVTLIVAALFVLFLSRLLTRRIMKPIDALDFSAPLENEIYEEMDPLLVRIDEQHRMLRMQNEELARAENLRRDFTGNVSHEMKTPLQVISGYAELMGNDMVRPEDSRRFAGLIYEEAQTMTSLINDVLTLSRLDEWAVEDSDEDNLVPVNLYEVACRTVDRLRSVADARLVKLRVNGVDAMVSGNETLLEEMIYNLVENGIRYNHEGGNVTLELSLIHGEPELFPRDEKSSVAEDGACLKSPASGGLVELRVSDTGLGIPEEDREKVFERFYRLDKSRSKETGGTGLGLAIVKHAVIYHKGVIAVESEVGKGTTFIVHFPEAYAEKPCSTSEG